MEQLFMDTAIHFGRSSAMSYADIVAMLSTWPRIDKISTSGIFLQNHARLRVPIPDRANDPVSFVFLISFFASIVE